MRTKRLVLLLGLLGLLAIVAATTMAVARPSAQSATSAKKEAVLKFSIAIGDPDFDLLRVADIATAIRNGANIGSSGNDGFGVDSFFDIEYRLDLPSPGHTTLDVEIHATPNNPDLMNPGTVIDNVLGKVESALLVVGADGTVKASGKVKEYTGHVTLLK